MYSYSEFSYFHFQYHFFRVMVALWVPHEEVWAEGIKGFFAGFAATAMRTFSCKHGDISTSCGAEADMFFDFTPLLEGIILP